MAHNRVLVIALFGLISLFVLMVTGIRSDGIDHESSAINVTGADYVFAKDLAGNGSAVENGTGSWYSPVPPVRYVAYPPDYFAQWVLSEWNEGGNGTGYPPAPPISSISHPPDYFVQWVLSGWNRNGSGSWYPPVPPVKYVSYLPDFLVQ